jgi:hypothetical protein
MKYRVGDLVVYERNVNIKVTFTLALAQLRLRPRLLPFPRLHLQNTFGIITEVEKHTDIFEKGSTENDNGYIWYSQIDAKTYWFCENELTEYEVAK